ncbi:shikimate dehydrogenase family protein [Radicibacter daui]|uniref:shikimate dehydrogenase family protein n=1 Tax=Radicibacter daui TaxID=3064829 RepID=UPI004046F776
MSAPTPTSGAGNGRFRLGLIGDNIFASRSPDLHRIAGELSGLDVSYDLLVPHTEGLDFPALFERCREGGYAGLNITYPYKEKVVAMVHVPEPAVARLGSVNTVVFAEGGPLGYNTDHSGFIAGYRLRYAGAPPGRVMMVGAGGVGRAVAFGLVALGAEELTILDADIAKAERLAGELAGAGISSVTAASMGKVADVAGRVEGIVNCTPVGMVGYEGTPVEARLLGPQRWAFDAVYTPVDTRFKQEAEAAGIAVLSGYELFFHQGIDAFRLFTGRLPDDLGELRRRLGGPAPVVA